MKKNQKVSLQKMLKKFAHKNINIIKNKKSSNYLIH